MTDSPVSKNASPSEHIQRILSDQNENDSNESKPSTPGFQSRKGHAHHSVTTPSSNIIGVLKELKDDIVDYSQACNHAGKSCIVSKRSPATGMGDVYIEQNGKFIKAPKELLEHSDFNTKEVYLEEIGSECFTPLDVAIIVEKGCSSFSRILLGILAGLALLAFILIISILNLWDIKHVIHTGPFLGTIAEVCQTLFYVILSICLVSVLDWLDLAHTNAQHMVDSFQRRKIFFVLIIYLGAMFVFLLTAPSNDYLIYNMLRNSNKNASEKLEQRENEVLYNMNLWKTLTVVYLILCIVGWFVVTLTRNEDLFYLHLLGMKKYEACGSQMTFENQIACCQFN